MSLKRPAAGGVSRKRAPFVPTIKVEVLRIRKYHPDANIGKPGEKEAEEKFKQIQQAYTQVMKEREQGYSSYGYQGYGYQQSGQTAGGDSDTVEMQAALALSRRYRVLL